MAGSILSRKHISDAMTATLEEYMWNAYDSEPVVYPEIVNEIGGVKGKQVEIGGASGITPWSETDEGEPVDFQVPVQRPKGTYVFKKYTAAIRITDETIKDGLYGNVLREQGASFGTMARTTIEQQCADIFNTDATCYDTQNYFDDAHPLAGSSSTYDNNLALAFSAANLATALLTAESTNAYDEQGNAIVIKPNVLAVVPTLKKTALEALHSIGRPGTANNDVNVFNIDEGWNLRLIVWRYLTGTTGWYVGVAKKGIRLYMRESPYFENNNEFTTGDYLYKGIMRWRFAPIDWRYWLRGNA